MENGQIEHGLDYKQVEIELDLQEVVEYQKANFIEQFGYMYTWRAKNAQEAKKNFNRWVQTRYGSHNILSLRTIRSLINKFKTRMNEEELQAEIFAVIPQIVQTFKRDASLMEFNWLALNDKNSAEQREIYAYIYGSLKNHIEKMLTEEDGKLIAQVDGKRIYVKPNMIGLEQLITNDEYELTSDEILSDDNAMYPQHDDYYSPFIEWFNNNKGELLVDEAGFLVYEEREGKEYVVVSKKGFLNPTMLEYLHYAPSGQLPPKFDASSDEAKRKKHSQTRQAIRERTIKAYRATYPFGASGIRADENERAIKLFEGFFKLVELDKSDDRKHVVGDWLRENIKETRVNWFIEENFTQKEKYELTGAIAHKSILLSNELANKVIEQAGLVLHNLKNWEFPEVVESEFEGINFNQFTLDGVIETTKGNTKYLDLNLNASGVLLDERSIFFNT